MNTIVNFTQNTLTDDGMKGGSKLQFNTFVKVYNLLY